MVRGRDSKVRETNVVAGLELHRGVLTAEEQAQMVSTIEGWVALGQAGQLRERTFLAPRKSMAGKGRVTVQFGCCYQYAPDSRGRQPGELHQDV